MKLKYILILLIILPYLVLYAEDEWKVSLIERIPPKIPSDNGNYAYNTLALKSFSNGVCLAIISHGNMCELLKSTDDGTSWNTYYSEFTSDFTSLPSPLAISNASTIVDSTCIIGIYDDQGVVKRFYYDPLQNYTNTLNISQYAEYISMANENFGAASKGPYLCVTQDGWKTYKKDTLENIIMALYVHDNQNISAVTFFDDQDWYEVSKDFGKTWEVSPLNLTFSASRQFWINNNIGWIIGDTPSGLGDTDRDIIYKTTDAGISWRKQLDTFNYDFGLWDIAFKDENIGIAVGNGDKYLETNDGGETWEFKTFPESVAPNGSTHTLCMYTKDGIVIGQGLGATKDRQFIRKDLKGSSVEKEAKCKTTVAPNPSAGNTDLFITSDYIGNIEITINDYIGHNISESIITKNSLVLQYRIDAQNFAKGVYFYYISYEKKQIATGSFIVE